MLVHKKRTVLFLPAWYPTRNDDMGGIFVRAFGLALDKALQVHVLHVAADTTMKKWLQYELTNDNGIETHIVYYRKFKVKNALSVLLEGLLYGVCAFYGYYQYLKKHKRPDFFHVFVLTRAALLPLLLSLFRKTDYYVTEVWSRYMPEDDSYHGFLRKWLGKRVVANAKGVSVVSHALKNALINHGLNSHNFEIIHSVVPADFFRIKLKNDSESENHRVKFLHVSCFDDPIKNISGMLNAFKLVQNEGLDFELNLVGNGIDFEKMQKHAQQIGLSNVKFSGKQTGEELFKSFEEADTLVLFSNYETQGCVILEAHAAGMPVIGSSTGGITELIDKDKGLLVPPGDEEALAAAIKFMINNISMYSPHAIREYAVLNYSYDHVAEKFIKFYQKGGTEI